MHDNIVVYTHRKWRNLNWWTVVSHQTKQRIVAVESILQLLSFIIGIEYCEMVSLLNLQMRFHYKHVLLSYNWSSWMFSEMQLTGFTHWLVKESTWGLEMFGAFLSCSLMQYSMAVHLVSDSVQFILCNFGIMNAHTCIYYICWDMFRLSELKI
jgi:hypothetical protein